MGQGRDDRRALPGAGAARNRPCAAQRSGARALPSRRPRRRHRHGPQRRRENWPGAREGHRDDRGSGPAPIRRSARHRNDRPRLGAGHEARRRRRHRSRWPHLPRGHRQSRARHTCRRRHRWRHLSDRVRWGGHRVVRGRGGRIHLPWPAPDPRGTDKPGGAAADANRDDDERGQSGRGVLPVVPAERRCGLGAPRVHHQRPRAHASDGAASPGARHGPRRTSRDRPSDPRLCRQRAILCRQARRGRRHDRRGLLAEGRHRAPFGLQDQRIRRLDRRRPLRAEGGEPHDRLPRCVALLRPTLSRRFRARVPGHAQGAR